MSRKFTQKEFVERHVEFLKNYGTKYKFQDLDFRAVMGMSGCDEDEFKEHMDEMWAARRSHINYSDEDFNQMDRDWGDGEDDDDGGDNFSRKAGGESNYDDSNEY